MKNSQSLVPIKVAAPKSNKRTQKPSDVVIGNKHSRSSHLLEEVKAEVQVQKLQGLKKNCQLNSRNKVDFAKQRGSIALADKSFTSIKQRETSKSVRQSDSETMNTRR